MTTGDSLKNRNEAEGNVGERATVFDFCDADLLKTWWIRSPETETLELSERFSTSGKYSIHFATPAYRPPMEQWPAFEGYAAIHDWSEFDRLVIDVTNLGVGFGPLGLFISDGKTKFNGGLAYGFSQRAGIGTGRHVISLDKLPEKIDRKDISKIHIYVSSPTRDVDLWLSGFFLLKPGEEPPPYPAVFMDELRGVFAKVPIDAKTFILNQFDDALEIMENVELESRLKNLRDDLIMQIEAVEAESRNSEMPMERIGKLTAKLAGFRKSTVTACSRLLFEDAFIKTGFDNKDMMAGIASSMVKVLPKDNPIPATPKRQVEMSLAHHEWQSFQIAVTGRGRALKNVSVNVENLKSDDGTAFSRENIQAAVVGFVKTETEPPYPCDYVGWWPDPILDSVRSCDIADGDVQTFWIRVHSPEGQRPGLYAGALRIVADGVEPIELELVLKVRTYTLPDKAVLPTAIHTQPPIPAGAETPRWEAMKYVYADFLGDYKIGLDQIYRKQAPDMDVVEYLHRKGRLVAFNFATMYTPTESEEDFTRNLEALVETIRPAYEKAKQLGVLDHAYIYGYDECHEEQFANLERTAARLHKEFPGVFTLTTSYDDSYGTDGKVPTVDGWCPLSSVYSVEMAEKARKAGKSVWWYICCGPLAPFANWFVECPPIEARLLMGAMTAKYRPDGFLYYFTDYWNKNTGIVQAPFTNWNPVSWTNYHGDGSIFYCDANGAPIPSIRLENYRDGMQDLATVRLLEEAISRIEAKKDLAPQEKEWLARAKAALVVPETLVKTMADFSHEPERLLEWREAMGNALDDCPGSQ